MKFALAILLMFAGNAHGKTAPQEMTEFNKTCPAPTICVELSESLYACESGEKKSCDSFVDYFKKALPEYDCQRKLDSKQTAKYIVPAYWLCDSHDIYVNALSKLKSKKAQRLYGSKELRATLDGHIAEDHLEKSKKVGRKLKLPK
ncbi:hypothetical protein AZI86_08630 [Bdellovibrio bacteriovorus]|uniref:Uncharacterized protein n=1 Tax=Bdellovibrio bacteriovorus TaxID=959 RepID=A0A150WRS4_BDEBC|nr:hypothetical protein [Bdellovibrio bacteriovorus]KYG67068.1 hypothetical protein AZI86_08630 [Bdellovibrio bacteriovorus]